MKRNEMVWLCVMALALALPAFAGNKANPDAIELAPLPLPALFKFNCAIIEPWGMYASAKHPWWHWPNATMTKAEVRHAAPARAHEVKEEYAESLLAEGVAGQQ